ncbi:MAG: hypothetical protein ACTHX2_06225 [Microbacterium sp.]
MTTTGPDAGHDHLVAAEGESSVVDLALCDTLRLLRTLASMSASTTDEALHVAADRWYAYNVAMREGNHDKALRLHPSHLKVYPLGEDFFPETAEDAINSLLTLFDFLLVQLVDFHSLQGSETADRVVQVVADALGTRGDAQN